MSETQLERSVLEAKERDELFAIADALGAKPGTRAKKADLVTQILRATGIEPQDAGDPVEKPRRTRARRSTAAADSAPESTESATPDSAPPAGTGVAPAGATPPPPPRPPPPKSRPPPERRRMRPHRGGLSPGRQAGPLASRHRTSPTCPARRRRRRPGRRPVPPADPTRPPRPPGGPNEWCQSRLRAAGHNATARGTGRADRPARPYPRRAAPPRRAPRPAPSPPPPPPARRPPVPLVERRVPSGFPRPPTVIFLALDRDRHQRTPSRTERVGRLRLRSALTSVAPPPGAKDAASRADRIDPGRRWSGRRRELPTATSMAVRGPVAGPDRSTLSRAIAETVGGGGGTASSGPIETYPVRPRKVSTPASQCR